MAQGGQYGAYQYESSEARALGSITVESYDKDQAKNLIKLNNDVTYMAAYMRKMQKGIDQANQNVIQQIQAFINDIIVVLGGGDSQGLDLGDLKYVLQMFGALLGFNTEGGIAGLLPLNAFNAIWHMLSTYIFPADQFRDVIEALIDQFIATILGAFGEIPIVGEALQQLAVIISTLRDAIGPLIDAVSALFGAFGGDFLSVDLGIFDQIFGAATDFFGALAGPFIAALVPIFKIMAQWTIPFVEGLTDIIEVVTNVIRSITGGLDFTHFTPGNFNLFGVIGEIVSNLLSNIPFLPLSLLKQQDGPNLLVQPGFDSNDSIQIGTGWIRDTAAGRTSLGAAKATASGGFTRELQSIPIPVAEGQKLRASVWVRWQAISYSGTNPIGIYVNRFNGETLIGTTMVATVTSPGITQNTWQQFMGEYTVPAGIDKIRLSFRVLNTVTTGQVWFDDASLRKFTDGLQMDWIAGLQGVLNNINNFLEGIVNGVLQAIGMIPLFGRPISEFLEALIGGLTGWFDDTEASAAVAADAKMGVQATQDIIVSGITAADATNVDDEMVQAAVTSQTSTIISQGAQLEALTSQLNGQTNSGVNVIDTFEETFVGELNPALWQKFQISGTASMDTADGHNAMMAGPNGEVFYRYIGPGNHTLTPFQRVTATIASSLQQPGIGDGRRPRQHVYCRVSDDGTKWVRLGWNNLGHCIVDWRNGAASGKFYESGDFSNPSPGAGSSMTIEPGVGIDSNKYRVWKGNTPMFIITDEGNVTDQTQLGYGIGLFQDGGFGCGGFTQFTASDNAQAATVGIGFRGYASSDTGGAGNGPFPANAIDTVERMGANMTFDKPTQTLTINTEGWYLFEVAANTGSVGTGSKSTYLYKKINGVDTMVGRFGQAGLTQIGSGSKATYSMSTSYLGNLPLFYAEAGSQWRPGCSGGTIQGDAAGLSTVFAAVLLNRSLN